MLSSSAILYVIFENPISPIRAIFTLHILVFLRSCFDDRIESDLVWDICRTSLDKMAAPVAKYDVHLS